jgi:predicted aspartyl protease
MTRILCGLLLAWAAVSPAFADCPPLTLITSVEMRFGNDNRVYVPVKINGTDKTMLVDTGGFFTEITSAAAAEMNLQTRHTGVEVVGLAGDTTDTAVTTSFALGNLRASSMDFMIMPGGHQLAADVEGAAGILAPNLLRSYDADFDFGNRKFNLLSQDHCEGKVIYWPADAVAVVPISLDSGGSINFPVELDGVNLNAILDTGASESVLNLDVATDRFNIHPGDSDTPAAGHMQGRDKATTYTHRFKSLSFEGIAIGNPSFRIIPDLVRYKMHNPLDTVSNDTHIKDPSYKTLDDMIVGMDVLRRLHVYVAYKEKKLYITPASPAPPAPPAATMAPGKP